MDIPRALMLTTKPIKSSTRSNDFGLTSCPNAGRLIRPLTTLFGESGQEGSAGMEMKI